MVAAAHYERLNYVCMAPAAPSGNKPHASDPRGQGQPAAGPALVRKVRIQRGLTQQQLADLCGMHRNSIQKIEKGLTREITAENADALSAALKIGVEDLGLHVRTGAEAPSIRLRQLTAEQRQIVDELLSLPAEDYVLLRAAVARLRERRSKQTPRKGRR
jgi:transcriptional regulator with XRE-family HTH domain